MAIRVKKTSKGYSVSSYSKRRTLALLCDMAQTLLERLPSDVVTSFGDSFAKRDLSIILPLIKTTPNSVWGSAEYISAWFQLQGLFKKVPWTSHETGLDPQRAALDTFLATERRCARTNKRFRNRHWWRDYQLSQVVMETRRIIARILSRVSVEDVRDACRWSGGATTTVRGETTHLAAKWDGTWGVTPDAYHTATAWLARVPDFQLALTRNGNYGSFDYAQAVVAVRSMVTLTSCCEVMFVPKTAWTHRTVTLPVLLNNYVQNGIGDVLRRALLREGVDLRDQSLNQKLALIGATTGSLATLDLSSASDLISYELVKLLFPSEWFDLMVMARERQAKLPSGEVIELEKMCGMGNGYCFPMQTIIFYALCKALGSTQCRVYGDDIIVQSDKASSVMFFLNRLGLSVNSDKSFWTGPFRESCGSNWYGGQDVTPVYVRDRVLTPRECIVIHNQFIRRNLLPYESRALSLLRKYVAQSDRYVQEEGLSEDGGFISPVDVIMASDHSKWDPGRQTWNYRVWRVTASADTNSYSPLAVYWMFLSGCRGGKPARRFRARTSSSWHLPKEEKRRAAKAVSTSLAA